MHRYLAGVVLFWLCVPGVTSAAVIMTTGHAQITSAAFAYDGPGTESDSYNSLTTLSEFSLDAAYQVGTSGFWCDDQYPPQCLRSSVQSVASAELTHWWSGNVLTISGDVFAHVFSSGYASAQATSTIQFGISVDQPYAYTVQITPAGAGHIQGFSALGNSAPVYGPSYLPFSLSGTLLPDGPNGILTVLQLTIFSGHLSCITYNESNPPCGSEGAVSFSLQLTPVPVPAAAWLLGSAVGALAFLRRRTIG